MARRSPPEGALIAAPPPSVKKRVRICPEVTAAATECENGGRNNSDVDRRRFSLSSAGTIPPSANGKRCVQFDFSDDDDDDEDDDDDDEAFAKSSAEV